MSTPAAELRVMLLDTWDQYSFRIAPGASVTDLKRDALARAGLRADPAQYEVKYNGARLDETGRPLAELGLPSNAAVIVLSTRRRPAR